MQGGWLGVSIVVISTLSSLLVPLKGAGRRAWDAQQGMLSMGCCVWDTECWLWDAGHTMLGVGHRASGGCL